MPRLTQQNRDLIKDRLKIEPSILRIVRRLGEDRGEALLDAVAETLIILQDTVDGPTTTVGISADEVYGDFLRKGLISRDEARLFTGLWQTVGALQLVDLIPMGKRVQFFPSCVLGRIFS